MLTNLFESRNKTFLNLVKLGDYLGRSLRENVELFNVENDTVTYITESEKAIVGTFDKTGLKLTDIIIEDCEIFTDKEVYSKLVDNKVSNFLADLLENDVTEVQSSFDSILNLWEARLTFDRTKDRLTEKTERFDERTQIVSTAQFARVLEVKDDLVAMLKESENFINIPEIRNTIKLSSVISKSFNLPRISYETLAEDKAYEIPAVINHTLYDHLCKHELITKELVEAKVKFENVWLTNEKVQKLPTFIYESNDNIAQLVAEIISEVPYFAMASKKQISNLVENNLDLLVNKSVPHKDIKEFVGKIFEFKKPVKSYVNQLLNEKYGVNVQNLVDVPTFDALAKTQVVIFESLARLAPKNSVLRHVLHEFSETLKNKNGVESIDVSDFLDSVFTEAEYTKALQETSLMNYLNFDKVADDLGKIGQVLKMIQAGMGGAMGGGAADAIGAMAGQMGGGAQQAAQGMASEVPEGEGQYETDGGPDAGMDALPDEEGEAGDQMPAMDAEDAASEVQGEEAAAEMGEEGGMEGGNLEGYEDDVEFSSKEDLIDHMRELEELIATLKSDMGVDGEEGMEGEMGEEGGMEGEEEMPMGDGDGDEMPNIDTGEGDDEVHIDTDSHNNDEGEGEEEEEMDDEEEPPAKPKKKKGKSDE